MIALLWTIPVLILRPFQNTPFSDDWVYGWSVEHLLRTHTLKILDIASSVNPVQVLWGALFCVPTGVPASDDGLSIGIEGTFSFNGQAMTALGPLLSPLIAHRGATFFLMPSGRAWCRFWHF